jgi:hypothetical protein
VLNREVGIKGVVAGEEGKLPYLEASSHGLFRASLKWVLALCPSSHIFGITALEYSGITAQKKYSFVKCDCSTGLEELYELKISHSS